MSRFIQSLESRTFFSITAANLATDKATIVAQAVTLKAALNTLTITVTAENEAISRDFKGLPKADQRLLGKFIAAEIRTKALLLRDVAGLNAPTAIEVNRSVAQGNAVIKKTTAKSEISLERDITLLDKVTTLPLERLQEQLADTSVTTIRNEIVAALPTDTTIDNAIAAQETFVNMQRPIIGVDAVQEQTDVTALATDLTTLIT